MTTRKAAAGRREAMFVAFLRGINVGRAKRVAMGELRAELETLGYGGVRTLLNSGNVVFSAASTPTALALAIERTVETRLKVSSRVTVLTEREIAEAIAGNPLAADDRHPSRLLVAVLSDEGVARRLEPLVKDAWGPEMLALGRRVAYLWCPAGVAASPLLEAVGRIARTDMTVRNWATFTRLGTMIAGG